MKPEVNISRRTFNKALLAAFLATAISSPFEAFAQSNSPTKSPEIKNNEFIQLGNQEIDLSLRELNLKYTPDDHTPYVTFSDGTRRYFISSEVSTFSIDTGGESLRKAIENKTVTAENIREVYGPEQNEGYQYAGITGVYQLDSNNEKHLTAILHEEERINPGDSFGFRASVAKVESFDGGLTWQNKEVLIKGDDFVDPGEKVSGAGQPSAIQIGDSLYIYYTDWSAGQKTSHPDQIYLAKANIANGTIDSNLEFYTNNGFVSGQESDLKSVIPVPEKIENSGYSALPSVSYNDYLKKFVAVFETNVGFCYTTSEDGINWSDAELIARFPQTQGERKYGNIWFSYPTLVSDEDYDNDHTTGKIGILYYSKGEWSLKSHNLVAREFEIA